MPQNLERSSAAGRVPDRAVDIATSALRRCSGINERERASHVFLISHDRTHASSWSPPSGTAGTETIAPRPFYRGRAAPDAHLYRSSARPRFVELCDNSLSTKSPYRAKQRKTRIPGILRAPRRTTVKNAMTIDPKERHHRTLTRARARRLPWKAARTLRDHPDHCRRVSLS